MVEAIRDGDGYRQPIRETDYAKLGVSVGLRRRETFLEAVRELALLARSALDLCDKPTQRLVLQDVERAAAALTDDDGADDFWWGTNALAVVQELQVVVATLPRKTRARVQGALKRGFLRVQRSTRRRMAEADDDGGRPRPPHLPDNVLSAIFSHLPPRALAACACVSRSWSAVATSGPFWAHGSYWRGVCATLCPRLDERERGEGPSGQPSAGSNWKEEYRGLRLRFPEVFHLDWGERVGCRACFSVGWGRGGGGGGGSHGAEACHSVHHGVPLRSQDAVSIFMQGIHERENPAVAGKSFFTFWTQCESKLIQYAASRPH